VTDTGLKATAGSGVRSSKTNAGQVYHTDNSFNLPPGYVALLCLQPAQSGGESGLISFDSIYNRLLSDYPEVLPRLYQPFYFDRQREHSPQDDPVSYEPVFELHDDELQVRLATNLIRQGYIVADKLMDDVTDRALRVLDDVMESPGLAKTFDFKPGQIQILNNRRIGHRRTGFTDAQDPARKRHMVRIWLRDHGRRFYLG
jgi:alpha-ketoglutarate-dependent taurine dioxygenase